MGKAALLVTSALIGISAGGAWAAAIASRSGPISPLEVMGAKRVLYNQNSNNAGPGANSQNFTSGAFTAYDDQGADDFVVPTGEKWTIMEIDVTGAYYNGY